MPNVCVIIPMYNFNGMTTTAIDFCIKNAGIEHDIIVVDDYSIHPFEDSRVKVLRNDKNMGFTYSINRGILECDNKYDYIMILNNDTEAYPDFLKNLVTAMEAYPIVGIAGSTRYVPKNGAGTYELYGADWIRGCSNLSDKQLDGVIECCWVTFCCVLLRNSVIREIGLLDKRMRNYCSDNDYCARVVQAGYKVIVVNNSVVLHYRGTTITDHEEILKPFIKSDQKVFLEKLSGLQWQKLLMQLPLDVAQNIWGRLSFDTYKKPV